MAGGRGDDDEGARDRRARRTGSYIGSSAGGYGSGGGYADYREVVGPGQDAPDPERVFARERFPRDRFDEGHRGRGPRGWRRSDARILEDLAERLTEDRHIDASTIEIHVRDGEVTLEGTVPARPHKRYVEDLAEDTGGVTHVQNNLRVDQRARTTTGGGRTTGGAGGGGGPVVL
ncbi:BON domain-containing protein [Salinarimonas rosea]|uniref:BON domain-containing protein n=1 Tax=Salinarimonas rosea TaxID=552063 RepID=UPI00041C69BA|nr:BON domain-containing protein [Salinarimonas rosea]